MIGSLWVVTKEGTSRRFCPAREAGFLARRRADTDFLPPGARIAQRLVFGSDYENGWRVPSSEPSSAWVRRDHPSRR